VAHPLTVPINKTISGIIRADDNCVISISC
jgi:hypothetical protein